MSEPISAKEASVILGVSTKRVYQFLDEGLLQKASESPVRLNKKQVLAFHASRQSNPSVIRSSAIKKDSTMAILELIKEMQETHKAEVAELVSKIEQNHQREILSAEMNQNNLLAEINRLKAENEALGKRWRFFRR
jgi:hypothetical protein